MLTSVRTLPDHAMQQSDASCRRSKRRASGPPSPSWAVSRLDAQFMNARIFCSTIIAVLLFCGGCGSQPAQPTVEGVRSEVAKILKKDAAQIDVAKPLVAQGADELDIVEIVMALEEAYKVKIPDSALGKTVGEASKTLTVQKLTEIVSSRQKTK
jgi:acyl carrier protein